MQSIQSPQPISPRLRTPFGDDPDTHSHRGGSCIVRSLRQFLRRRPNFDGEAILTAEIDRAQIIRGAIRILDYPADYRPAPTSSTLLHVD